MKTKYIFIITLLSVMISCNSISSQNSNSVTDCLPADYKQSQILIDRFNMLRTQENLQRIEHDTVLDNICKILLTDKTKIYRKSAGIYNEDSVRIFLYNKGIIDYQYEIKEISDRDTSTVFKEFFVSDKWNHLRAGYYRTENKHILFKTYSYLHSPFIQAHQRFEVRESIGSNPPIKEVKFYTDTMTRYFKILIPDIYYFQFYEKIPLSSEKEKIKEKNNIQIAPGTSSIYGEYDFSIKSVEEYGKNMFLIILNKNNQKIAVID